MAGAVALIGLATAPFPADARPPVKAPGIPGFNVPASNGFALYVSPDARKHRVTAFLYEGASGREPLVGVSFTARARIGRHGLQSSLGPFGRIAIRYRSAGRVRRAKVPCEKKALRLPVGRIHGVIEVHGDGGFADASATSARTGALPGYGASACFTDITNSGAIIQEAASFPGQRVEFLAYRGSTGAPSHLGAEVTQRFGRVDVRRIATAGGGAGVLTSTNSNKLPLKSAVQNPPAPFFGSAELSLSEAVHSWMGDLGVSLPGIGNVRLAGPEFKPVFPSD